MKRTELAERIIALKQQKNVVILAHYYQEAEIQDIADYIGDSLGLSQKAATAEADIILSCGVHFMGETAKIINPGKKVLVPDLEAGCSLAESCPTPEFKSFVESHPDHTVVTYINCSAEIKALSDIVCTSSNAQKIIESIPADQPIIFAPDRNLGMYLQKVTGRDMLLWDGSCTVHEAFSLEKIIKLKQEHPDATFIAHPESEPNILRIASYIGSTAGMLKHVKESDQEKFIVATEHGILHEMQKLAPEKELIPAPAKEDNTCACSECAYMKMNTLEKIHRALVDEQPSIELDEEIRRQAVVPIQRMLEIS